MKSSVRVWLASLSLYSSIRVLKLLATFLASESLMQLEVVFLVPQDDQGAAAAWAVTARAASAKTERMLAVVCWCSEKVWRVGLEC